jgi:WD40 repeat protein
MQAKKRLRFDHDRFIPRRSDLDIDILNYKMLNKIPKYFSSYEREIEESILGTNSLKGDILPIRNSQIPKRVPTTQRKKLAPMTTFRILSAPDLRDDYYVNLLDWSSKNMIALSLPQGTYVMNMFTDERTCIFDQEVDVLKFNNEGSILAMAGCERGLAFSDFNSVTWHYACDEYFHSLDWFSNRLATGIRTGKIWIYDTRCNHNERVLAGSHRENVKVCGLKWSQDGLYLASGAGDDKTMVWDSRTWKCLASYDRYASVKALAWCPSNPALLASGCGQGDRRIIINDVFSNDVVSQFATESQISSLFWLDGRTLLSTEGWAGGNPKVCIWDSMSGKQLSIGVHHKKRIVNSAIDPTGSILVTASADEQVCLWKIPKEERRNPEKSPKKKFPVIR